MPFNKLQALLRKEGKEMRMWGTVLFYSLILGGILYVGYLAGKELLR